LFDVVLIGFPEGPKAGATPAEALSQVFGVPMDQAEKVVGRMPTAIRKGVAEGDFRKFNGAFTFMGAVGEFRPASGGGAALPLGRPATAPMAAPVVAAPVVTASLPSARVSEPSGASELARIGLAKARVDQVSGAVVGLRSSGSVPIIERSRPSGSAAVVEGSSGFLDEELDALPTGEGWSDGDEAAPAFDSLQGLPVAADAGFDQPLGAWQPAAQSPETKPLRADPEPLPAPMLVAAPGRRLVIETGSVPQSPSIAAYFTEPPPVTAPPVAAYASLDAVDEMAASLFGGSPEAGRGTGDEILFGDPLDFALDPLGVSMSTGAIEPERAPAPAGAAPVATAAAARHPWSRGSGSALALLSPSANLPAVDGALGGVVGRATGSVAVVPTGDPNDASRLPGLGGALDVFSGSYGATNEPAPGLPRVELAAAGRRELSGAAAAVRPSLSLTPGDSTADAQPAGGRRPAPQPKAAVRRGPLADKSFNESIGYCLTLPLQPSGYAWVGFGALFGLIGYLGVGVGHVMPFAGLPLMLIGMLGTVAFAFGIFAACMRATLEGEKDVDAPPAVTGMVPFLLNATPLVVCAMLLGGASLGWLSTKADAVRDNPMMTIMTTFVLGAPFAYWPMALAYAVKSGAPTKVFSFGTVIGRIVSVLSHYILVVFLGAVALFVVFAGLTEAVGTVSLPLLQVLGGLVAGAALMVAHAVMGGLMGKLLNDDPKLFDR
jgi:hypothetical protein